MSASGCKNDLSPRNRKRSDMRHGRFLKIKRHAPNERGEKNQKVSLGAGQSWAMTSVQGAQRRKCRQGFLAGFDVQHGGAVMGQEFLDLRVNVIAKGNGGGKHAE